MKTNKTLSQLRNKKPSPKKAAIIKSKKVEWLGTKFDSMAEVDYLRDVLIPRAKAGEIHGITAHPTLEIIPGMTWTLDFMYRDTWNNPHYVDVKGMKITDRAKTKIQIWESVVPLPLHVVQQDIVSKEFLTEIVIVGKHKVEKFLPILTKPGEKLYF